MINYGTLSSDTARSRTGIYAFLIIASHISETVGTNSTFGSAIRWRVQISRETRADSLFLYPSTLTVRSTGCRVTWVFWYYVCLNVQKNTITKGITISIIHDIIWNWSLEWIPFIGEHCMNALPDIPCAQVQTGTWFMTEHTALTPQIPRPHGSRHLFLMQAWFLKQSEFKIHSGRHPRFGFPWYSGRQLHIPLKHCVFEPQLKHGSVGLSDISEERISYSVCDEVKFEIFSIF